MRIPLQLWLPLLSFDFLGGPSFRDLQRAQEEWKGEHRIWLLPEAPAVIRWACQIGPYSFHEMAVQSETFNVLSVIHVDDEGNCFPSAGDLLLESWEGRLPADLLMQWLNQKFFITPGKKKIKINVPDISGRKVKYKQRTIKLSPGPSLRISQLTDDGKFKMAWPDGKSELARSVNPEEEIRDYRGLPEWEATSEGDFPLAIDAEGMRSLSVWLIGSSPFDKMFPSGLSLNDVHQQSAMKSVAMRNDVTNAKRWLQQMTTVASTTLEASYLAPVVEARGSEAALCIASNKLITSYGSIRSLQDLAKHEDYPKVFLSPVKIRRCFGWLGYFWWELNQLLEKREMVTCELCGNLIFGKIGKRFCGKAENPNCYHSRRAADVSRNRRRAIDRRDGLRGEK